MDVNGDGLVDIFVAANEGYSQRAAELHLNRGDGTFREVSAKVGLRPLSCSATTGVFFDFDNDGDQDLVTCGECFELYESRLVPDGTLRFEVASERIGPVANPERCVALAVADVNADGVPDLYAGFHGVPDKIGLTGLDVLGAPEGHPTVLLLSQEDGTYQERSGEWGAQARTWTLAVHFADLNRDARPDLLVANDFFGGTVVYLHAGTRFEPVGPSCGLEKGMDMGLSVADFDHDGNVDVFVTRMSSTAGHRIVERIRQGQASGGPGEGQEDLLGDMALAHAGNKVYRGLGDGRFELLTEGAPTGGGWGWGGGFLDVDNDGWDDLFAPNGYYSGKQQADT